MRSLLCRVMLVVGFSPFLTLNMSCHFLLACRVSAENSTVRLKGVPLHVICCFSLFAFNIFSLYLIFDSLINMCLGMFSLTLSCMGISVFPGLDYFLSHVREVCLYNFFKYFLRPFLFLYFFWDPYYSNVGAFSVVPEGSETLLNSFHSFFLYPAL